MFLPPPLYLQLYSVWLMTESQRMMLQMFHRAINASHHAVDTSASLGQQAIEAMPAPLDMPHVDSTPV
jgi:hypothetical protein